MTNVVLIGFQGSGKTTLGRLIAENLNLPFIDTDHLLSAKHGGMSCRMIYRQFGENYFRAAERKIILQLETLSDKSIISLGGGGLSNKKNAFSLQKHARLLYLNVPFSLLIQRMQGLPAYLPPGIPFIDFYQRRRVLYEKWAHQTINLTECLKENLNIILNLI